MLPVTARWWVLTDNRIKEHKQEQERMQQKLQMYD
jgi:hypothetical protein